MKVGVNEAQELKQLAEEKELPFANLLRTYVLEDLMTRIYGSDYRDVLLMKEDGMFGEEACRRGGEETLAFYYQQSSRPIPGNKLLPGQRLDVRLMESFVEQVFAPENAADIRWESEVGRAAAAIRIKLTAFYKEMIVPVTVQITALNEENQRPERKVLPRLATKGKELAYWKYSSENRLSFDLFQMMDRLELIGDMGVYFRTYQTLLTQPLSGRHIVEELAKLAEQSPQIKRERRLEQLSEYRSYAYMRKRWNQYLKRHREASVAWEEALDLILAFLTPVWESFCRDEIFFDDWMPELGRYM